MKHRMGALKRFVSLELVMPRQFLFFFFGLDNMTLGAKVFGNLLQTYYLSRHHCPVEIPTVVAVFLFAMSSR